LLYRDFTLGYFGKKVSIAQKEYHKFVTALINKKYDNPCNGQVKTDTTKLGNSFILFLIGKSTKLTADRRPGEMKSIISRGRQTFCSR